MVTPEQVDQLLAASQPNGDVGQAPATDDELKDQNQITAAALQAPAIPRIGADQEPASPTNAASVPNFRVAGFRGTFADRLANAAGSLIKSGVDPMSAMVAGSLHALSPNSTTDTPVGTVSPSDIAGGGGPSTPTTPAPKGPGKAQSVINAIGANLGDTSAATEGGTAGGGIAGAFRVLKAGATRQREEQENRIKLATANTQMLHEQMLIHRLGEEEVAKSVAMGQQSMDEALTAPGAETLASNKTSDEIAKLIQGKTVDPSANIFFVTGRKQVGEDSNGVPIMRTTYSVVKPGGRIQPTQTQVDFLNKYLPGANYKGPDDVGEGKEGQSFDSHTWAMLNQRAMNNMAMVQTIQKISDENESRAYELVLKKGNDAFFSNPAVMHAFNAVPPIGKFDSFHGVKAYYELQKEVAANPELLKSLPKNWLEQAAFTFGGGDLKKFEDQINKYSAITEKAQDTQHDVISSYTDDPSKFEGKTAGIITAANGVINRIKAQHPDGRFSDEEKQQMTQANDARNLAMAQAQEEAKQKGAETAAREGAKEDIQNKGSNGSSETGQAFLQTLPPARRAVIQGYIDGTSTFTQRMSGSKFGQDILRDIRQAMGSDWDQTKGESYAKNRQNFTSGKESVALEAANTAMHHMGNMWAHLDSGATTGWTGSTEQFFGANKEARGLVADAKAVASELGRLYTGGVIGEKDQKEWADKLDPKGFGMTADKLRTNIAEFMSLLGGKLESMQATWDKGTPNPQLQFPMGIITKDNRQRFLEIAGRDIDVNDIPRVQHYRDEPGNAPSTSQKIQQAQGGVQKPNVSQGGVVVDTPDGPISFKTEAEANAFKAKAGIQ